jgi:hypothetical protein
MEAPPVMPGLNESSLNTPETDKDGKDKKDTKQRLPIERLFANAVHKKPENSLSDLFSYPLVPKTDTERSVADEHTNTTEAKHDQVVPAVEHRVAPEPRTEWPEQSLPTAEEAWARLEQRQRLDLATQPDTYARTEAVSLPLHTEGELLLPLEATDLHKRLHFPKAEQHDDPEVGSLEPENDLQTVATETTDTTERAVEPPRQDAEGGSAGGGFEPPHAPERSADGPEPEPNQPLNVSSAEAPASWYAQTEQQHQARRADALEVNQPLSVASETKVIERENAGAALFVGMIDWYGRRRIRRELRRGQKRQDRQIKQLQKRQLLGDAAHQRHMSEQQADHQSLRRQFETVTQEQHRSQEQARQLENQQARLAAERPPQPRPPETAPPLPAAVSAIAERQTIETPHLPPDHRIQQSTWHNIEVDKSGHAVEQPVLVYGQEFQREQQQETRRDDNQLAAAVTGQVAVSATTGGGTTPPPAASSKDGLRLPSTMLEQTVREHPSHQLPGVVKSRWTVVVLIVLFFAVVSGLILR